MFIEVGKQGQNQHSSTGSRYDDLYELALKCGFERLLIAIEILDMLVLIF